MNMFVSSHRQMWKYVTRPLQTTAVLKTSVIENGQNGDHVKGDGATHMNVTIFRIPVLMIPGITLDPLPATIYSFANISDALEHLNVPEVTVYDL